MTPIPWHGMIRATYADGGVVAWQYDQGIYGIGHLTAMTDLSGHTGWTYDQHGRVLAKQQTAGRMTFTTFMSYDAAGRLATFWSRHHIQGNDGTPANS